MDWLTHTKRLLNLLCIVYVIKLAKNLNFHANGLVVKHRKGRSKLFTGLYLENMDTSSRPSGSEVECLTRD